MSGAPTRVILIAQLAPTAPPCFEARDIWLSYLTSAAEAWRDGFRSVGPLLYEEGAQPRFNPRFNFCADCSAKHALAMTRTGRCQPDHLKKLAAPAAAPTTALDGQEA